MSTMQEQRQIAVRAVTGTTLDYNGDWEALFDFYSIPQQGGWDGRMLAYINQRLGVTYTNLPGAMQALALDGGATNFSSLGTFTASIGAVGSPANTVAPSISPSTGTAGTLLTVTDGTWTGTPSPTFTYEWRRNGVSIGGETANTYTLVDADVLTNVRARVTGTNINGVVSVLSSNTVVPTGTAPANTVAPVISPASGNNINDTVTVTNDGTWTGTAPVTFTYQWRNSSGNIIGATNSTYVIQAGDQAGGFVFCRVTGTNVVSSSTGDSNQATIVAGLAAPVNTVAPVASPSTAAISEVLTVTNGTWTGNPTPTYTYQWQRSTVDIPTATSSTYLTQGADDGVMVRCVVTATNTQGVASANSNDVAVASSSGASSTQFNVTGNSQYVAVLFEDI